MWSYLLWKTAITTTFYFVAEKGSAYKNDLNHKDITN